MGRASRAVLGVWIGLVGGCLRAPLSTDTLGDEEEDTSSTGEGTGASDDVDGLGMSGPLLPSGSGADEDAGDGQAPSTCHPSYVPCLPVVDDLDCAEVRALDAAPVEVVGEDVYGLDADHDGVGCEG